MEHQVLIPLSEYREMTELQKSLKNDFNSNSIIISCYWKASFLGINSYGYSILNAPDVIIELNNENKRFREVVYEKGQEIIKLEQQYKVVNNMSIFQFFIYKIKKCLK